MVSPNKPTSVDTHTRAQSSYASVELAQALPNNDYTCTNGVTIGIHVEPAIKEMNKQSEVTILNLNAYPSIFFDIKFSSIVYKEFHYVHMTSFSCHVQGGKLTKNKISD